MYRSSVHSVSGRSCVRAFYMYIECGITSDTIGCIFLTQKTAKMSDGKSKRRNLAFGRKQRTVIISAEFGGEQIHETGHRSFFLQTKLNPLPLNPHPPPKKKSCCILFRLVKVDVNDTGVTHQLRMELFSCLVTLLTMNKCIVHAFFAYLFNEK